MSVRASTWAMLLAFWLGFGAMLQLAAAAPVLTAMNQVDGWAWCNQLAAHDTAKPITITATGTISEEARSNLAGIWLAGLATQPAATPSALVLCWAPTPTGWFGDRWGLQLASATGLLPGELRPQPGVGFLQDMHYISLLNVEPAWGHQYEATLSYYPASGAVAVQVADVTTGQSVYSGAHQIRPYQGPDLQDEAPFPVKNVLYPGAGYLQTSQMKEEDRPPVSLDALSAASVFTPLQVAWGLIQPQRTGLLYVSTIDRREETGLRLTVPWRNLPGEWVLTAGQKGWQTALLRQSLLGEEALFTLPKSAITNLPVGKVTLTLEFRDQEHSTFTDSTSAAVGVVQVVVADMHSSSDAVVSGKLRALSDGAIGKVHVRLTAKVTKQLYDRDDRGVLHPTLQPVASRMLIDNDYELSTHPMEIPFSIDMADVVLTGDQYIDGQLVLEPTLTAETDAVTVQAEPVALDLTLGQPSFTVDPTVSHQTIDGFGVSGAWWAQYIGGTSDAMRNRVADLLFSMDSGIGLSQYRYNIGGGIDPTITDPWRTAETFEVEPGVYDWSRDANARWFLQAAKERGVEDFVLFAVSPPARLTRSGHTYNKDKLDANISAGMYPQFAQYLVDIWKHFRDEEGITFSTVSPFNEPEWSWEGDSQEGTPLTRQQVLALSRAVASAFSEQNVSAKLLIPEAGAWEFLYGKGRWYADMILADPVLASHTILAMHSYWTTDAQRQRAGQYMTRYPDQRIWQTEWCEMLGGRDYGMGSALTLAHTVHADLTLANVSAWQHWVAVNRYDHRDSLLYTEYFKPGDQENIEKTKKLWSLGNFSRFIRPGAVRIDVRSNYALAGEPYRSAVLMSAFRNVDGKWVVVAINQSDAWQQVQLSLLASKPSVELTPYRTSDTESLERLTPVRLTASVSTSLSTSGEAAIGTVALAPLSVTTFVAE